MMDTTLDSFPKYTILEEEAARLAEKEMDKRKKSERARQKKEEALQTKVTYYSKLIANIELKMKNPATPEDMVAALERRMPEQQEKLKRAKDGLDQMRAQEN